MIGFDNKKIGFRLVSVVLLMLVLLWTAMISWSYIEQKANAETQARDFAGSVHQMTLAALTGMMMTGTIGQREVYLDQIKNTSNVSDLEVFRSEHVNAQFGPGTVKERAVDADEASVLKTGQPVFRVDREAGYLKAVMPAIAQTQYLGKNCLMCHVVEEGTVLGAISMKVSLATVNAQAKDFVFKLSAMALALGVPFLILVFLFVRRSVTRPLATAIGYFEQIGSGNYDNRIDVHSQDEVGTLLKDLDQMQGRLKSAVDESKRKADETMRIKVALDNATAAAMIADNSGHIIYLNKSVLAMLKAAEDDIRRQLPSFNADQLIGANIDSFHRDPSHQRSLLASLSEPYHSEVHVGGRIFRLTANPVTSEAGERLGTSVEWLDATQEVRIQNEVQGIVRAALAGDLSQRIGLEGKAGYMRDLSDGINQLVATNEMILKDILRVLTALADGDLTEQITNDYQGMFGDIQVNSNVSVGKLQDVIRQILEIVESINTAASEIAQGNNDLSQRTEEQATSLEETVSSMEEFTTSVKQNAESATEANDLAAKASSTATRGGEVVQRVVSTMASITESSRRIEAIISVIDGIAFQTNILALNAAVEAARAGEQGRGFAVVATEVRNLAQRSAGAAKEIKALIEDSVERIESGAKLADQAGHNMNDIVSAIANVAGIMADISAASVEQAAGIDQVNQALNQMDSITQQNAALVEQAAAAAESLEEQARSLTKSVSVFRLSQPGRAGGLRLAAPRLQLGHSREFDEYGELD